MSRATVSNAYNRPDQLSVELRAHVLETARRLGYTGPDPAARALVRGRTGVVGALFSEPLDYAFEDPAAVLVLRGLAQECRETHTGLLLLPIELDDAVAEDAVHGAAVDGLVAYSLPDDAPVLRAARSRAAACGHRPAQGGRHRHRQPGRPRERPLALDHLLALGHRRVAALGYRLHPERADGPVDPAGLHASRYRLSRERAGGYQQALRQHRRPPEELGIFQVAANTRRRAPTPLGACSAARRRPPPSLPTPTSSPSACSRPPGRSAWRCPASSRWSAPTTCPPPPPRRPAADHRPAALPRQGPPRRAAAHCGRDAGDHHRASGPSDRASVHRAARSTGVVAVDLLLPQRQAVGLMPRWPARGPITSPEPANLWNKAGS